MFTHNFVEGNSYTTYELQSSFKHNRFRGMRYSKETKTLVLIINHVKSIYEDKWDEDVLYYTGMGTTGDQNLEFMQNKRLANSRKENTEVYVFEIFTDDLEKKYVFVGKVELCNEPYKELQYDENNNLRYVWIFPLKLVKNSSKEYKPNKELLEQINKKKINKLSKQEIKIKAFMAKGKPGKRTSTTNCYQRNIYVYKCQD